MLTGFFGGGDGQSIASKYGALLGGLEQSNSNMNSMAERLANFNIDGYGKQATDTLARANSAQEKMLAGQLGAAGWSTTGGGTGLSALSALRGQNQATYGNSLLQAAQLGAQNQQAAAGIYGQVGQNNLGLLNGLLGMSGSVYGNALNGMGNLNSGLQQNAAANAAGRGQFWGGVTNAIGTIGGAALGALL